MQQALAERLGPPGAPSEVTEAMARKTSRELAPSQRKACSEIERIIMEELVAAGERQDDEESG